MGSSGGGKEYKESPETRALTAQQTALLKDIQDTVQQFDPMTFSLMGLKQVGTQWELMSEEERVAALQGTDRQMYDLQQLQYQRLMDAYGGKASISPSLEADLAKQRMLLEQTLSQKLGANWATSTPGIQAMSEFEKNAELLRETARQNEIASGQSLLMQNLGYQADTSQQKLSNFVNVPSARYQGNLSAGQNLLNSSIQRDAYKANYAASTQGPSQGMTALSGAATGAMTGASVGGPWGAAIGGAIGGIGGLLAS